MPRYTCQLCGGLIRQRSDEIIRVIVEKVSKEKGDESDPSRWSGTKDWVLSFLAHAECAKAEIKAREYQQEIPGMGEMFALFDEQEEDGSPRLAVLEGGQQ